MHSSFCSASFWVLRLKLSTSIYDLMLLNVYHFHHHHPHSYLSIKSLIFLHILTSIEILVLISWIPASENFFLDIDDRLQSFIWLWWLWSRLSGLWTLKEIHGASCNCHTHITLTNYRGAVWLISRISRNIFQMRCCDFFHSVARANKLREIND